MQDLEAYRPKPHREFLRNLRTLMWGYDVGPGGAPSGAVSTSPATGGASFAGFGPNKAADPSRPLAGVNVPHAVRDFVRFSKCVPRVP